MIAFPAAIGSQLGLFVWNRIKDIDNKICNQNCYRSSCSPNNIIISLSTLGSSIYIIYMYICWDTHSFKTPVLVQKIKVDHSCSYLAVFSLDIRWWFYSIDLYTLSSWLYHNAADTIQMSTALIISNIMPRENNSWG